MSFPGCFSRSVTSLAALTAVLACGSSREQGQAVPFPSDAGQTEPFPPTADDDSGVSEAGFDASSPPHVIASVPASLVQALSPKPYVEEQCTPATFPGFPYPALRCTYGANLVVTVADPPPERVARWIVESSYVIASLAGLEKRDSPSWEAGLVVIARNVIGQSSRIFPLDGQVREDKVYTFLKGVTRTCSTGCYCRINSTSRQEWCAFAAATKGENEANCLATYGTATFTEAWANKCLANHAAAWEKDVNDNFRARAFVANQTMARRFPNPDTAVGADVVTALKELFPGY